MKRTFYAVVFFTALVMLVSTLIQIQTWKLRGSDIKCIRAAIALILDASVQVSRDSNNSDAELRHRVAEGLKRTLLEPRDCPELENRDLLD